MNSEELAERILLFAVRIVKLSGYLKDDYAQIHIGKQILRSGTSVGANYEEARGAESDADFLHKLNLCLKEIRETHYWLKILHKSELMKPDRLDDLINEADELCAILVSASKTMKEKKRK